MTAWTPSRRRLILAAPALLLPSRLRGAGLSGSVTPQLGGGIAKGFDGGITVSSGPAVPLFNPTALFASNTGGWWDPSDHTTTFQDTAGTMPANSPGQTCQLIKDKSGNGNNLLQAAGSTLNNSGSFWWLEFDGVANFLAASYTFVQPITRISAARVLTWVDGTGLWDGFAVNTCLLFMAGASPGTDFYAGTTAIAGGNNFTVGADHVASEFFNGISSGYTVDHNSSATGNPGTSAAGGSTVGSRGAATNLGNIRWYGGIHIGRALTGGEAASCVTFFGAKAGLAL